MQTDFEVIQIVDDSNPYPALLGIDWATDMNGIINLKKKKMIFEKRSLRVVVPLDPAEGVGYTEPVRDDDSDNELDCIYQIMMQDQDQVNLTADGRISWEHDSSCTSDSDEEIEHWQNRLHEVTTLNCNMMIRSLWCVTPEEREIPTYDGVTSVDELLDKFESIVLDQQRYGVLEWALHVTPTRWWSTHQKTMGNWHECRRQMHLWFRSPQCRTRVEQPGQSSLCTHLCRWVQTCVVQEHPKLRIENQNPTWQQERRCTPQIFHDKAFKKLGGIMNRVHQVRRTDWDLHIPAVQWAYREISKNRCMEMTPTLIR